MLKELNNLYFCLVFVIFQLFLQTNVALSNNLYSQMNSATRTKCFEQIKEYCPDDIYKTKQEKRECFHNNRSVISKECRSLLLSNIDKNSNFTDKQQADLYLIFTNACQDEAVNICNAKIKKNILKVNSIDRCLKRISNKQKLISRKCTIALTSYINNLINEKIQNNEYHKENNVEKIAKKLEDANDLKKMSKSKIKKMEREQVQEEYDEEGEEYEHYTNGTKIKKKYLKEVEKKFGKSGMMSREEYQDVIQQYLQKQGWIEEDD